MINMRSNLFVLMITIAVFIGVNGLCSTTMVSTDCFIPPLASPDEERPSLRVSGWRPPPLMLTSRPPDD